MSDEEKRETEKKRKGSGHSHQYVTNTVEATQARKEGVAALAAQGLRRPER